MTTLPRGWAIASLDEIAEINPRHSRDIEDSLPVTFVRMPALSETGTNFQFTEERELGKVRKAFTHFAEGDVLFAKITPCMENGKAAVASHLLNGLGCGTTELHVLRPRDGISSKYIYHFIHRDTFREEGARNFTGTAGQLRVPVDFMREAQMPLAPSNEQRRIVAKLEKLLSRVDAVDLRLQTIPRILKRFRQSALESACSGRLTANWREETRTENEGDEAIEQRHDGSALPHTWRWDSLESVCDKIVDCPHSTPKWASSGKLCIRTTNFRPGFLDLSEVRYVSEATFNERIERLNPKADDVVYSREGGILGVACVIPAGVELCLGQRMMLFRLNEQFESRLLMHWLNSPVILRRVRELTGGSASPHLNVRDIKEFPTPIPPLAEQKEIVRRVEALFKTADALEARYRKAKAHVDKLTQSILAKAFRGELVPQDPNDEPAAALLDRLRCDYPELTTSRERIKVRPHKAITAQKSSERRKRSAAS
jgi:type I restriction enzyme S subunit